MRSTLVLGLLLLLPGVAHAHAVTAYEQAVLAALNAARADPVRYAAGLKDYRTYFHGKTVVFPGERIHRITQEGTFAVDEAVALVAVKPISGAIAPSNLLADAAADHVAEQAGGATGHYSPDGSSPADRVRARGGNGQVAEVISYGARDPVDVVRQLIVDDGVKTRGHRDVLFYPSYRYAGVACGPHAAFRIVCVIDLSDTAEGKSNLNVVIDKVRDGSFIQATGELLKGLVDPPRPPKP